MAVVFDLDSSGVSGAYLDASSLKPRILYATKNPLSGETVTEENFVSRLLWSFTAASTRIQAQKLPSPESVHVFLPPLISRSELYIGRIARKQPFTVTKSFVENITPHIVPEKNAQGETLLESKTLSVTLNGYEISNPFGKSAKEISLSVFATYAKTAITQKLIALAQKIFHKEEVIFHTQRAALFAVIRDIIPEGVHFVILKVSGEMTELLFVNHKTLTQVTGFFYGARHIVKEISRRFSIESAEARTMLDLAERGGLETGTRKAFEDALAGAGEQYRAHFEKAFRDAGIPFLGGKVFIVGDPLIISSVLRWVSADKRWNAALLDRNFLENLLDARTSLSQLDSAFLAELVFIQKIL